KGDLQFTYDLVSSVLLFYLIYLFYLLSKKTRDKEPEDALPNKIVRFINFKKIIAVVLVPLLLMIAIYSFATWAVGVFDDSAPKAVSFKNINNVFFEGFF
ncbi:hypothetical protein RZS08_60960, partial [Arthrospira platensis SPKY1]|nr:hypothetical protein [Arthrospira platensis SPKY1]